MSESKKLCLYCSQENLTVVELENNVPLRVFQAPILFNNTYTALDDSLTGDIIITDLVKKVLKDHSFQSNNIYISLPMKEVILRSFIIPWVNAKELEKVIKFEARKYVPLEIEELKIAFHAQPFMENKNRRYKVTFFAARYDVLERYEKLFQELKLNVFFCEPCQVSLARALLYKKEIDLGENTAFFYLDTTAGYIYFIANGMPQFVREFQINTAQLLSVQPEEEAVALLQRAILNEATNSFDFYFRKLQGQKIDQMIFSSSFASEELLNILTSELRVPVKKFSSSFGGLGGDSMNQMDVLFAMGSGLGMDEDLFSSFNFFESKSPKLMFKRFFDAKRHFKEVMITCLIGFFLVAAVYGWCQMTFQNNQKRYDKLCLQLKNFSGVSTHSLQAEAQDNIKKLDAYKDIRTHSDMASILLRVSSFFPKGMWLNDWFIKYEGVSLKNAHLRMDIKGDVFKDDMNKQIAAVNDLVVAIRNDKILSKLFNRVQMGSLIRDKVNDRDVTSFSIHCS